MLTPDLSIVQKALTKIRLREEAEKKRRDIEAKIQENRVKLQTLKDMDQLMTQQNDGPPNKRMRLEE